MNNDLHEPKPGEPITASWASGVARAVRRSETTVPDAGGYTLPGGTVPGASGTQWTNADYPSLFDLRFRADDDETHALLYIGFSPICYFDEASVTPTSSVVTENGWMDIGVWSSPGQHTVELVLLTTQNMITHHNDAAWRIAGTWWILIDGAVPTGMVASYNYRRTLFSVGEDGPHKMCCAPIQFSSRPVDTENLGPTGQNRRSLDTKAADPVLQVYGFDDPTVASNPYASTTPPTGITNTDWMLLLRRVKSNGDVEIQYLPLATVAGSPGGSGQPLPYTPVEEAPDDGKVYGRKDGDWEDIAGKFWPQGGSNTNCYGASIGDMDKTAVILLGGGTTYQVPTLKGAAWACEGAFNCEGTVNSTVGVTTSRSESNYCQMWPSGDMWATMSVNTNVVVCNYLKIDDHAYMPKQITFMGPDGRPHTETVLAQGPL